MGHSTGSQSTADRSNQENSFRTTGKPGSARLATGTVQDLCRSVAPLGLSDTLAHAVEALRLSPLSSLPLVAGGRLLAVVSEADLARLLLSDEDPVRTRLLPLQAFLPILWPIEMRGQAITLHLDTPLDTARRIFAERPDLSLIPVLDDRGLYHGVITNADLVASLCKTLAPARVGGMATPLGVYLTDGVESGGAGDLGLFLSGMSLLALGVLAILITGIGLMEFRRRWHIDLDTIFTIWIMRHGGGIAPWAGIDLRSCLVFPLTLLLLRLVPISGYHAAEHQVIHCIERGEPLLPANVARMPRPHPRCGTNLVAAVTIMSIALSFFVIEAHDLHVALIASLVTTAVLWRPVGTFLQQYLTTRPANARQIASGIRAGEEILTKFRSRVERQGSLVLRIWRMGLLQMMAGGFVVLGIMWVLTTLFPALDRLMGGF